jgi:putative salt-induced outer membrane protein YdiY
MLRATCSGCLLLTGSMFLFADQVTLKNGDTITGEIIKKDGDKLTMKSAFLGEVSMPWAAVAGVKSDNPLFVALPDGRDISGKLVTQGATIEVEGSADRQAIPLSDVSAIRDEAEERKYERLKSPPIFALWAGYFDLGLALARGNARTSIFTTALNASRVTRTDKTTIYLNQIQSSATLNGKSATTAQAIRGGAAYDHNLSPRLFFNAFNDYEHDRFQNLDLRFVAGGGLGLHAIKAERLRLDLLGGADYERENFNNHLTRSSAEGFGGDDLSYKLSSITALTQSARMFSNLTRTGEYRTNFDLGTVTTLKKWLSWQITASDRYLSNPAFGRQRNDLLLTTGLRVSFAR